MEGEKVPLSFAFIIEQTQTPDGNERFGIRTVQAGLPSEMIITFMKNWLKNEESRYHEFFKKEYL
jgi:hypothetical protein